ncbi:MAG: hypothetical protein ACUVQP_07745 [Bacteroidales bacterium]
MAIQTEKPRIHVKTKNLQLIFDYCIESKTEFTVIPKNDSDTWEIELAIKSIIDAVKWGMFLKANKIDLVENPLLGTSLNIASSSKTLTNSTKTKALRKNSTDQTTTSSIFNDNIEKDNATEQSEKTSLLSFEEDKKQTQQNELF